MKKPDRRLQVGAILTVLTTLLFFMVFSLNTTRTWWRGAERVRVTFSDVQGIRSDDPVHFHGIPCGRVIHVSFSNGPGTGGDAVADASTAATASGELVVTLELEVPSNVFAHLRQGSVASIDKTLTGVTVVQLFQGDGMPLDPHTALVGTEATTLTGVTAQLSDTLVEVNGILASVHAMVARAEEEELVIGTLATLRESIRGIQQLATDLRATVAENRQPVREFATHAAAVAAQLDDSALTLPGTLSRLDATVDTIGALAGNLNGWFQERRADLSITTEEIASAATHLNTLSTELRHRPWRLLHSPTKEEALELDVYESVAQYARGAVELRRGIDRVALLLEASADDPALERQLAELLSDLAARIERQQALEQGFLRRLDYIQE